MNKKLLICGSAIAVVVLVLASFSPVVGYNRIESSTKDSPLFAVRTKRAINEKTDGLTRKYIGEGRLIPFPTRNSKTTLFQKAINKISKMDEKTFDWLMDTISNQIHLEEKVNLRNHGELLSEFVQIRKNPEEFKAYAFDEKDYIVSLGQQWYPGCFILFFILLILEILCELDPHPTME